jgi:hypothetical protein
MLSATHAMDVTNHKLNIIQVLLFETRTTGLPLTSSTNLRSLS